MNAWSPDASKSGEASVSRVQQIVDCLVPHVPLELFPTLDQPSCCGPDSTIQVQPAQPQIKVIDRDALALELAREWVRARLPATLQSSPGWCTVAWVQAFGAAEHCGLTILSTALSHREDGVLNSLRLPVRCAPAANQPPRPAGP